MTSIKRNSVTLAVMVLFNATLILANAEYKNSEQRTAWAQSATVHDVESTYRDLLHELSKKNVQITSETIETEVGLISKLSSRQRSSIALALINKYMQMHFTIEFEAEVAAILSNPEKRSRIKNQFGKIFRHDDYQLLSKDDDIDTLTVQKACTCGAWICCLSCGGTIFGGLIGGAGSYLVYTFGWLIASGIAGPLDGYTWPIILSVVGSGTALGGLTGGVGGCLIGCCIATAQNWFVSNDENPLPGSTHFINVIAMTPETV